jgi:hypothetical protein
MMHIPTTHPACWTTSATPRPWNPTDNARACRAWPTEEIRKIHNGDCCDGCARLEVGE